MNVAQNDLCERASRAMFALIRKAKHHRLPIDLTIDLFDKTVLPVLTYGCELWGFAISDIVKKLQLKFYKLVLKLKQSTPSYMVFGETGTYPVDISIKTRLLCFWFKLVTNVNDDKLTSVVYRCLLNLFVWNVHQCPYLLFVERTLNELGLSNLWLNQGGQNISVEWFKEKVKVCLKDQFLQTYYSHVDNDDVYSNYRMFKPSFGLDPYFTLLPDNFVICLARFRTTNNVLPVNRLRYNATPRHERICEKCTLNDIADEFHYLFVCPYFNILRKQCLARYYLHRPNVLNIAN